MEVVYREECINISTDQRRAPGLRDGNGRYQFSGTLKCAVN